MRVQCAGSRIAELFKFATDSMEWTDLSAEGMVKGTMPSGRGDHTMAAVGSDIYLFGGTTDAGEDEGRPASGGEEEP